MPQEAKPCAAHRTCCACRSTSGFHLTPGTLILQQCAGDDFVGNASASERTADLGYTAGRAIRQPLLSRHGFVCRICQCAVSLPVLLYLLWVILLNMFHLYVFTPLRFQSA